MLSIYKIGRRGQYIVEEGFKARENDCVADGVKSRREVEEDEDAAVTRV